MKARSLAELAALKAVLLHAQQAAAEKTAHERELAAREQQEQALFSATVGQVIPLRKAAADSSAK